MVGVGGNANFSVFRCQHVGIPNAELLGWGCKPTPGPNVNGFVLQWNIGLNVTNLFWGWEGGNKIKTQPLGINQSVYTIHLV